MREKSSVVSLFEGARGRPTTLSVESGNPDASKFDAHRDD